MEKEFNLETLIFSELLLTSFFPDFYSAILLMIFSSRVSSSDISLKSFYSKFLLTILTSEYSFLFSSSSCSRSNYAWARLEHCLMCCSNLFSLTEEPQTRHIYIDSHILSSSSFKWESKSWVIVNCSS